MNPTFSIIIPVYNVAPYLRECLDSVLAQTYTDWEAICVDDGSTDGSGEILDEYAKEDKRFRVIHQKNAGVSTARNAGLDSMLGKWILFLDADDVWRVNLLSNISSAVLQCDMVDMVKFGCENFQDGMVWDKAAVCGDVPVKIKLENKIPFEIGLASHFCEWAYKHEIVKDIYFNQYYCRGEDLVYKCECLLRRATTYALLTGCYYGYRQQPNSAMHKALTCHALESELRYRVDILCLSEFGSRKIEGIGNSDWMNGFISQYYIEKTFLRSSQEIRVLMQTWFEVLPKLTKIKEFPQKTKIMLRFSKLTGSVLLTKILCFSWKKWLYSKTISIRKVYRYLLKHGEYACVGKLK